jgi:hypothetical protein
MSSGSQLALETPGQIFDPQRTLIDNGNNPSAVSAAARARRAVIRVLVEAINPILDTINITDHAEPLAGSLQLCTLPS